MNELYPLLMVPHFDARPWGARDLAPIYDHHVHPGEQPIGEAWLTWDKCHVGNGPLAGEMLGDLCRRFGRRLVGSAARESARFPLLTKFLFPRDKLSVQVHPDDDVASRHGEPCGKTECWYVVDAAPGSQVALGLKAGTTREQFERSIRENCAEEYLNWVEVHAGEMIYVEAGTVHTMGGGPILLEVQQNSDSTYRLYDYGRPRELHVELGLEAMKERTHAGKVEAKAVDGYMRLAESACFVVDKFAIEKGEREFTVPEARSAQVIVAIDGCGVLDAPDVGSLTFAKGDAVVVPAVVRHFRIRPQWTVEFLRAALP